MSLSQQWGRGLVSELPPCLGAHTQKAALRDPGPVPPRAAPRLFSLPVEGECPGVPDAHPLLGVLWSASLVHLPAS